MSKNEVFFYFWIFYFLFFPRNEKKLKYLLDGDVPVQNSFNTAGFTITSRIPHCFHATTPPLSLFSQLCFKILKVFSHHFSSPPISIPFSKPLHILSKQHRNAIPIAPLFPSHTHKDASTFLSVKFQTFPNAPT